jgi:hypothetical protein
MGTNTRGYHIMFHFKFKENYSIIVVFDIGAKVGFTHRLMFYHTLGVFL